MNPPLELMSGPEGPTKKSKDKGVIVAAKLSPRGAATVNEPPITQSGGQAKPPRKLVNGLPV